ncbi:DUF4158 domain-containing protein [Nonomuraea purpurea]|uniref:DUF4158 domain-containing protein n=1 Tax=Nonomuraea purpurea TaxID=1849276 RepID=A0ABV8GT41_9ACTN
MITAATFVPVSSGTSGRGGALVREDVLQGAVGAVALVPEISSDELIRYFTPTAADVAFVDPGKGRGPVDRLGMLLQLALCPCAEISRSSR